MKTDDKILVTGHNGLVGSSIVRALKRKGFNENNIHTRSRQELNLLNQKDVEDYVQFIKPTYIICAAAKVGGIYANATYPAEFIYENLMIQTNIIHSAHLANVQNLLFLGSSCIYPKFAKQPIKEEYLLSDYLESSNESYSIAKITGIKMCDSYRKQYGRNYISAMPTNLYGPNDNYHLQNSHVLPALIRKFYEAKQSNNKEVVLWGTGSPKREFLYSDDLADACLFLLEKNHNVNLINIGTGEDMSIIQIAETVKNIVGFKGEIIFDKSKADGTPRKVLDVSKIHNLGWKHNYSLERGIELTLKDFIDNNSKLRL